MPLNITGELLWQVPTFAAPDPAKVTVVDLLLQYESLRLFIERAAAVQPGFALTPENVQAVVEICYRLDGIPLAIELAAARIKVLTVEQIASYLTRALGARFDLLTQGSRAAMPRHQTLRATIDWSYDLLDDAERLLFRQVAVFRGGFTLATLEQLVAIEPLPAFPHPHTLDLLTELVDQSLVLVEQHGGQNRYRLLETLREYALEQFPTVDELTRLQQRHADVFLHLAEQAEPELTRAQQQSWLNHLEIEHVNLRAALDFLITSAGAETDDDTHGYEEKALRLATAIHRFWEFRGYVSEGRTWLHRVLAKRGTATLPVTFAVQAKALNAAGVLAFRQGDLEQARVSHEEALFLFQQAEEDVGVAASMQLLASIEMDQGRYAIAQQRLENSLSLYRTMNHEHGIAHSLSRLGTLAWDQDRFDDACQYHRESLRIYQGLGIQLSIAFESLAVGDAERMLGNVTAARMHYDECLKIAQIMEHKGLVGAVHKSLGLLTFKQGDYEQARHYGEKALHIFRELGDKIHTGFALSHLGDVAHKFGENNQALSYLGEYLQIMVEVGYKWPTFYALEDIVELLTEVEQYPETAVRFLGAADVLRQETGLAVAPNFQAKYECMTTSLRQQLGDALFNTLWQEGEVTPLAQIVTEATTLSLT